MLSSCLTSLRHMGQRTLRLLDEGGVRVEAEETLGAEGVAAVNHDAGDALLAAVVLPAKGAGVLVDEPAHELVDLGAVEVWRVLRLLEEERGRVLQLLHNIQI